MRVLGIIPARKSSERFPRKHQSLLLGKPMFAYTIEAALASERLNHLVVSSDDESLRPLAENYGIPFIDRPAVLATATAALDDAVRHACETVVRQEGPFDLIVVMQGNVPVRKAGQIDAVIEKLESLPQATAVCTAQEMRDRPEWAKVITDERTGETKPFLEGHTGFRFQDYPRLYTMDGAVYAVRWKTLFEQRGNNKLHAWFGSRLHLLVQDHAMYSLEVDYPDQAQLAECLLLYRQQAVASKPSGVAATP